MNLMLLLQAYCRLALVTLVDNVSSSRCLSTLVYATCTYQPVIYVTIKGIVVKSVAVYLVGNVDSGTSFIRGALLSKGFTVQGCRVINSLRRVDPISQILRRSVRICRRQYSVPGPNALW